VPLVDAHHERLEENRGDRILVWDRLVNDANPVPFGVAFEHPGDDRLAGEAARVEQNDRVPAATTLTYVCNESA